MNLPALASVKKTFEYARRLNRLRKWGAIALGFGFILLLLLLLYLTDFILALWQRLAATPTWFLGLFGFIITLFILSAGWVLWRFIRPAPKIVLGGVPLTEAELEQRLAEQERSGLDVTSARRELEALKQRREAGHINVALLGDISSGKSSLVKALLPDVAVAIDPRGGTTKTITHYTWTSASGDQLIITDLPGLNEAGGQFNQLTQDEALRSHIVVYICDGDLTRTQYAEVESLRMLNKPMILALNKIDLLRPEDIQILQTRLASYWPEGSLAIVAISAGGEREFTRIGADGTETRVIRQIEPNIGALAQALQQFIDRDRNALEQLRNASVFVLTARKLDQAVIAHRQNQSQALISQYSQKAVVGAIAAVAPGSDVVIQGYLGYNLVKELCELYQVSVKQIDIQQFLQLATKHVGKTLPLMLAISGNICKAFPGVGTLAGGVFHAVAYGLIFESLGKAVAGTLESRGELAPWIAMKSFEENLGDDVETRAQQLVKTALDEIRQTPGRR